jgi:hypothetical protein
MGTRWDKPALRVIDGDPDQTARVRAWRAANPEWKLTRVQGYRWRLTNGRAEHHGYGWSDAQRKIDELAASPGFPDPVPAPVSNLLGWRPAQGPPDVLA